PKPHASCGSPVWHAVCTRGTAFTEEAHEETSSGDGGPTRASAAAEHHPAGAVLLGAAPARLERRAASDGGHSRRCTRRLLQTRHAGRVGSRIRAATDAALAAKQRSELGLFVPPGLRGAGAGTGRGPASPGR